MVVLTPPTKHPAQTTPYQEAIYGVPPPSLISYVPGTTRGQAVDEELLDCDKALKLLKENLLKAQNRMKQNVHKHRMEREFAVVDWAYRRLQPCRQASVATKRSQSLAMWYYGPFKVLQKIGLTGWTCLVTVGYSMSFMYPSLKRNWAKIYSFNLLFHHSHERVLYSII